MPVPLSAVLIFNDPRPTRAIHHGPCCGCCSIHHHQRDARLRQRGANEYHAASFPHCWAVANRPEFSTNGRVAQGSGLWDVRRGIYSIPPPIFRTVVLLLLRQLQREARVSGEIADCGSAALLHAVLRELILAAFSFPYEVPGLVARLLRPGSSG